MLSTLLEIRLSALALALAIPWGTATAQAPDPWVLASTGGQYFAVIVGDVDAAARWYTRAFGLSELDRSQADDGSWQIVNLHSATLFVELIRDRRATEVDRARGFFKVGFQVPDVEVVADRVEAATGDRPRVIPITQHGVRILQLRDPDGNVLQLSSVLEE